jgi:hypothetical protein
MMLALIPNISTQILQLRLPNRKCTVTILPTKPGISIAFRFHPFRRPGLDAFHELTDRYRSRQRTRNVNMIVARSNLVCRTIQFTAYTGYIFEQLLFDPHIDPWPPVLGAKHQMNEDIRQRLRHNRSPNNEMNPAPSGLRWSRTEYPGLRPGLSHPALSGHQLQSANK